MWLAREIRVLRSLIPRNEKIMVITNQRRLDFSPFYPSIIVATDKRLLICNRWFLGIKGDITFLPYVNITSYRMVKGILFSSILIRIQGSAKDNSYILNGVKEEGEIRGLTEEAAMNIIKAITYWAHGAEQKTPAFSLDINRLVYSQDTPANGQSREADKATGISCFGLMAGNWKEEVITSKAPVAPAVQPGIQASANKDPDKIPLHAQAMIAARGQP